MDFLDKLLTALKFEDHVMLATIVATSGSTPAGALSKMIVNEGGRSSAGTVGGGCMEGDVLAQAARLYDSSKYSVLKFHLNEDSAEHGLICGGSVDVLIEPISREDVPVLKKIRQLRDDGEDCGLVTLLRPDGSRGRKFIVSTGSPEAATQFAPPPADQGELQAVFDKACRLEQSQRAPSPDGEFLVEPVPGRPPLIIFGGGHVSRYVCRIAAMAGFRVTVIDDRPSFANQTSFPDAAETLAVDFLTAFDSVDIRPSTFVIIVTRGHLRDEEILERVIQTPARYIGMIGSKRKVLATYEHIVERGISPGSLRRVYSPVGLEIGAATAEEIAVSVVAEMIRIRRGKNLPLRHKSAALDFPGHRA